MPTPTRRAWMEAWEGDLTPSPAAQRSAARVNARMHATRYYSREATARIPEPTRKTEIQSSAVLPHLRVATGRRPRWGMLALALAFTAALLGAVIIAPVLINSAATGLETEVGQLETQQTELAAETAALSAQISALSSSNRVAEQAAQIGLGPAQSVRYMEIQTETAATEGDTTVAGR